MSLSPINSAQTRTNRRLFTVDEYERMGRTGVLGPDERTELIEGEIIRVTPMGSRHAATITRLNRVFCRIAESKKLVVASQSPAVLGSFNEPQPDLLILKWRKDDYFGALPKVEDVLLIVEVSDSTLPMDSNVKLPMYARQGVKEVWLFDLKKNRVEVHRKPTKTGYSDVQTYTKTATLELSQCKGVSVSLREILG